MKTTLARSDLLERTTAKWVYEGGQEMRDPLGGKGANAAEMKHSWSQP